MTLYHPTLPGVTVTVYRGAAKAWTDQGWRKTPPKTATADSAK